MPIDSIKLAPDPARWRAALSTMNITPDARRFREQLGLPTDRPVVMSGHQATLWHPGILAKYLAAHHAAVATGSYAAWLVVDLDAEDCSSLRIPVRRADGSLAAADWRIAPEEIRRQFATDVPALAVAPAQPLAIPTSKDLGGEPALETLHAVMLCIHTALAAAVARPTPPASLAEQFALATLSLIEPFAPRLPLINASALAQTDLFIQTLDRLQANPLIYAKRYNAAVAKTPEARLTPLRIDETASRIELPLWHVPGPGEPRRRVYAEALAGLRSQNALILPRALLMTGLLRRAACDLFIHGSGGAGQDAQGGYDRATELWLATEHAPLAPVAMATATVTLPILQGERVTPQSVQRARWKVHAARHNPALVMDPIAAARKHELLTAIARATTRSARTDLYRSMHRELDAFRQHAAPELDTLVASSASAARRLVDQTVADDRTYSFALHDASTLRELSQRIAAMFA